MIKILLKLWPALTPIFAYIIWVYVIKGIILRKIYQRVRKDEKVIDGDFKVVGENSTNTNSSANSSAESKQKQTVRDFSLENKVFLFCLYAGLIVMIISLILTALSK